MKLYHRTSASEKILHEGFRDGSDTYGLGSVHTGVWFSDRPLPSHLQPGAILVIDVPDDVAAPFERDTGAPFLRKFGCRQFLIPAEVANEYGPPYLADEQAIE